MIRGDVASAHLEASRKRDRDVAAKVLRDTAALLRSTVDALDPTRETDLSYINCTTADARILEERANAIELGHIVVEVPR